VDRTRALRATGSHTPCHCSRRDGDLHQTQRPGEDVEIGMRLGGLVAVADDVDLGPDGDGAELALVAAVVASCRAVAAKGLSSSC
jgi:hypothetical protein